MIAVSYSRADLQYLRGVQLDCLASYANAIIVRCYQREGLVAPEAALFPSSEPHYFPNCQEPTAEWLATLAHRGVCEECARA